MSCIPKCTVCDRPVSNIYAPEARCDRCNEPCPVCGGDVVKCQHPLAAAEQLVEVEHLGPGRIAA